MTSHLRLALVPLATMASITLADQWGPPQREHRSRNGSYVLQLEGGDRIALWPAGNLGSKPIWSRGFVNGNEPPYRAFVADDGRHVVLVDAHGRLGYEEVLVFLGAQGEVLRSYKLDQLLTAKEVLYAPRSVSSVHWSRHGWFTLRDNDRQFAFITHRGTVRAYETATGQRIALNEQLRSQIISEAISDARIMLSGDERVTGAVLLGVLDAKETAGELRELLTISPRTAPAALNPFAGGIDADVEGAAACALLQITGRDAFDLIEQRLTGLPPWALRRVLATLSRFDYDGYEPGDPLQVGIAAEFWERLALHRSKEIRTFALAQRLERDDGSYLRAHPDLLKNKDQNVRFRAYQCLSQHAVPEEAPLLRAGLEDADEVSRLWAWRGLVRLQLTDIEPVLKRGLAAKDSCMRFEAILALARRGDIDAKRQVTARIQKLKDHSHHVEGWGTEEMQASDLCILAAELKLESAREPLRDAARNPCRDIQQAACGALAALKDADALSKLREFAREGHVLERASAIRWLGRVHDRESLEFLRQAADEEDPWIREAAIKALANMGERAPGRPASRGWD